MPATSIRSPMRPSGDMPEHMLVEVRLVEARPGAVRPDEGRRDAVDGGCRALPTPPRDSGSDG